MLTTKNLIRFSKALAAKLAEAPDPATITISKSAFKSFVAMYEQFARAAGLGVLKLKWSVADGDLVLTTVSGSHKHKISSSTGSCCYWFDDVDTGRTQRWTLTSYGELFDAALQAVYDFGGLEVTSSDCSNILGESPSDLLGYVAIAVSGFKDKAKHVAAYESVADAVRDYGQKKVEALVRDIDKSVDVIRGRARTCAISNKRIIWNK